MKRKLSIGVLGVMCAIAGLSAQAGDFRAELTILDGVRFAASPPYRIVASDSDEEQISFARPDGKLITASLYYGEEDIDDLKAEILLFVRGWFLEEIPDAAREVFSIERTATFADVSCWWIRLNLDGRENLYFAADLREAPGGRVKFVVFSAEGDPREQERELRGLIEKLLIEIQDAAG